MKTKSILIIFITLIIGFLLGMLTSAQIRSHKLNPVRVFFSEERFREGFYRIIQPDTLQKAKIDVVLDKYAKITGDMQRNFRKELDASMNDFRKEIDTYLSPDQLKRLKEMEARRQKMFLHNRNEHHRDSLDFRDESRHHHGERDFPGEPPMEGKDSI